MRVLLEVDVVVELQDRHVVVQSARVKFRMHDYADDVALDVGEELDVVVDVPLAETGPKVSTRVGLDAVSGRDYVTRRNQGTAANVHAFLFTWLLLQYGHLPGILACD